MAKDKVFCTHGVHINIRCMQCENGIDSDLTESGLSGAVGAFEQLLKDELVYGVGAIRVTQEGRIEAVNING